MSGVNSIPTYRMATVSYISTIAQELFDMTSKEMHLMC